MTAWEKVENPSLFAMLRDEVCKTATLQMLKKIGDEASTSNWGLGPVPKPQILQVKN